MDIHPTAFIVIISSQPGTWCARAAVDANNNDGRHPLIAYGRVVYTLSPDIQFVVILSLYVALGFTFKSGD